MKQLILILCGIFFCASCNDSTGPRSESDIVTIDSAYYNKIKEDNRGKVLVINVFASWCPPCKVETPDFVSMYAEKGPEYELIGLSIDDKLKDLEKFISKYDVNYPIYRIRRDIQRQLMADKVPTTVIYRPSGMVYTTVLGMIDAATLGTLIKEAAQ